MRRLSFSLERAGRLEQKRGITLPIITLTVTLAATILMLRHQFAVQPGVVLGGFLDTVRGGLDIIIGLSFAIMLACAILAPALLALRLLAIMRRWVA